MTATKPKDTTTIFTVLLASLGVYAFILLASLTQDNLEIVGDLTIAGVLVFVFASISLYVPSRFKTHFAGLVIMTLFLILLIIPTEIIFQIFLVLFFAAYLVYFVFYQGIYTSCIDQVREDGITNEEYIRDINVVVKTADKDVTSGFLLKENTGE